jgi:MoaA/NifB/PqqE/SkfB family radical SAM enzyme
MSVLGDFRQKADKAQIPAVVHFDLTYRCHQDCLHCYLPQALRRGSRKPAQLATPQVKRVLDELAAAGTFFLTLSGGEVFLRPDLLEIVAYARRQNFAVALMTSGFQTAEAGLVRHLKELGLVNIYLSLYSLKAAVHDHITQTPGSWEAAWNTLANCRSQELSIVLNCIVMGPNYADMWELMEFVSRENVPLRWNYELSPRWDGRPHPPGIFLSPEQKEVLDREFVDVANLEKAAENLGQFPDLRSCAAGIGHGYLTPQADVWPCLDVKWKCGNILRAANFTSLWQDSAVLKKVRFLQENLINSEKRLCQIYQPYTEQSG